MQIYILLSENCWYSISGTDTKHIKIMNLFSAVSSSMSGSELISPNTEISTAACVQVKYNSTFLESGGKMIIKFVDAESNEAMTEYVTPIVHTREFHTIQLDVGPYESAVLMVVSVQKDVRYDQFVVINEISLTETSCSTLGRHSSILLRELNL